MTESKEQYTVSGLLIENELLRERVEALRKTADGFSDASSFQWSQYQRRIKELEAAVERLEQDNRRLWHLGSMPYWAILEIANKPQLSDMPEVQAIIAWVDAQDGDA